MAVIVPEAGATKVVPATAFWAAVTAACAEATDSSSEAIVAGLGADVVVVVLAGVDVLGVDDELEPVDEEEVGVLVGVEVGVLVGVEVGVVEETNTSADSVAVAALSVEAAAEGDPLPDDPDPLDDELPPCSSWLRRSSAEVRKSCASVKLSCDAVGSTVANASPCVTCCPSDTLIAVTVPPVVKFSS